ncbi:MAG: hypothetical protein MJ230_07860 [bacterium]|nr:hypothetical protein [bacterium]
MTSIGNNINFQGGGSSGLAKAITLMTKADALAPIVALEATVTGGRTIQAYKRGGKEEGRERIIEETTGAIVWLWGVKVLNELGDKILGRYLKTPGKTFDVGTDKVLRRPFENYMKTGTPKKISANKVAALKCAKVAASILIANLFVGFVVPTINHYITNKIRRNENSDENISKSNNTDYEQINDNHNENNASKMSFKGSAFAAMNVFTNAIENTNTGKLLSTDLGVAGGRMANARTKEERNEIAFRDLGSIYFYMWAKGHVGNLMNLVENGRATRLDPETMNIFDEHLNKFMDSKGGSLTIEEFKKYVLGSEESIKLPEGIKFEEGDLSFFDKALNKIRNKKIEPLKAIKVSELEGKFDKNIMSRIREMSKLQPLREGEAVVTKQQIIDAMNVAEINDPKLLDKVFRNFTNEASVDPYKYVSNKKLYSLKSQMSDYVSDICKQAKDGKITKDVLNKAKRKNITYNGINFATGFAVAAMFLSTIIPKLQYLMTEKRTGLNVFPGTYDYEHHRKTDV